MDIFKRISISFRHFYSFIVSCFRGKFISRRVLTVLLCFSLFSVPSYAADYNSDTIDLSSGTLVMSSVRGSEAIDYTSTAVIDTVTYKNIVFNQFYNTNDNYYAKGYVKNVLTSNSFKIKKNHTYSVDFKTRINAQVRYSISCFIFVYDGNGNNINKINVYNYDANSNLTQIKTNSFDFNLSSSDLPAGFTLKFVNVITVPNDTSYPFKFMITDISYTDTDDNTGLLNTIITAIGVVWNSIKDTATDIRTGFSNLGTSISNKFSELGNKISNSFDNLNQWLTSVKDSIVSKLADVKDGINNKLQELKDKLAQQIAQIKEDIRSLFVPSDGYFNNKRGELDTFFNEHFGALYQGPTILVNLIKKLVTISPQELGITLPAIEFMWQGKKVSLTEPIHYSFSWVNDAAHPLHFAYTFYRGFITVVMFVAFVTYLKNKYSYIFER